MVFRSKDKNVSNITSLPLKLIIKLDKNQFNQNIAENGFVAAKLSIYFQF